MGLAEGFVMGSWVVCYPSFSDFSAAMPATERAPSNGSRVGFIGQLLWQWLAPGAVDLWMSSVLSDGKKGAS
jgi:hypothetical protein